MSDTFKSQILAQLSASGESDISLYALLDPSRNAGMLNVAQAMAEEGACLFLGEAREEFSDDAPWLFKCDASGELARYLINESLGKRWAVFIQSSRHFSELFNHFRKFVKITDADDDQIFWRFYDPAILMGQMPFLTLEQRQFFFQGIKRIGTEVGQDGFVFTSCNAGGLLDTNVFVRHGDLVEQSEHQIGDVRDIPKDLVPISVEGASVRPMMRLTQSQIDGPLLYNRPALVAHVIETLDDEFRPSIEKIDQAPLYEMISHGIQLAMFSYAIHDVQHIELFIDFMFRIAPGWHKQPQLNKILIRRDITTEVKFDLLAADNMAKAWDDAERYDDAREWLPDAIARQLDANGDPLP
ncbi:DUF4123 domain-containing protein [Rhizobium oryziradicis]|uniref:DUF4123 domain-containing protein n=1 Tax=Rhizobium oryziradicis TaxID=1867956 RepID=A0A1Q8ZKM1_9HYPH|nr:DUF4123 domain-containing protein [Rhizobium oryziradicis]OLP42438.1 hypothetical protein BJF95_13455 [Rhizobium oryziradicis]